MKHVSNLGLSTHLSLVLESPLLYRKRQCPNCGACKESVEHVLFESASYDSQRQNFLTI